MVGFGRLDSAPSRWWILGLLAVWAILLIGGFVVGPASPDGTRRMPLWGRLGSSLMLVVAGWCWWWLSRGSSVAGVGLLIASGMTFGFVGDVYMAKVLPIAQPVIGGMSAFGLGHIAYNVAMLRLGRPSMQAAANLRWAAWLVWLALGAIGWYWVVWRGQQHSRLHRAALPYALLLASTTGLATGLALLNPAWWTLAVGGALFLISDLLLATQLFNHTSFPLISDIVWLTYGPAQALIVYTMATIV